MVKDDDKVKSGAGNQNEGGGESVETRGKGTPQNSITPILIIVGLLLLLIPAVFILEGDRPRRYWPREFYEVEQVILTGSEEEIEAALEQIEVDQFVEQQAVLRFDEDLLLERSCSDLYDRYGGQNGDVIALYKITRRLTNVVEIIEQVQAEQAALATSAGATSTEGAQSETIRAEPNWISGQPWEVEGSPWEVEGSPWEVEGSGELDPEIVVGDAIKAFIGQRAMTEIEYNPLLDPAAKPKGYVAPHVRVGIFDTSPFPEPVGSRITLPVPWVKLASSELMLTRDHPVEAGRKARINFNDHGLFVAGLVHIMAQDSNIELVRVLDGNNKGDLYTLIEELYDFIASVEGDTEAVINLSLGMRLIPEEGEGFEELSRELGALRDILAFAECSGVVVVAAAGNGSADMEEPLEAYYPAAWPEVIGVAASNEDNERSCYSNKGDVAAPGGEGDVRENDCRPLHYTCKDSMCEHGVLGPVFQNEKYPVGFAYWVGSSFATPLVSGLAAKIQEYAPGLPPESVRSIIECSARNSSDDSDLGAGVVNVQKAFGDCLSEYREIYGAE